MLLGGGMRRLQAHSKKSAAKKAPPRARAKRSTRKTRGHSGAARPRSPQSQVEPLIPALQRPLGPSEVEFHLGKSPRNDLGAELAEAFILSATSGNQAAEDLRDDDFSVETGLPIEEPSAGAELTGATGASQSQELTGEPPGKTFSHAKK